MSSRPARTIPEEKGHAALEVGARAPALLAAVIRTAILGYGALMADSLPPEHALQDEVREIRKPAERAAALTNQLLAFSRQQVLEPKVLSLNGLVENIEKMLRRVLGEHIELATALDPALANIARCSMHRNRSGGRRGRAASSWPGYEIFPRGEG